MSDDGEQYPQRCLLPCRDSRGTPGPSLVQAVPSHTRHQRQMPRRGDPQGSHPTLGWKLHPLSKRLIIAPVCVRVCVRVCAVCHLLKIGCLVFSPPQVQLCLGK